MQLIKNGDIVEGKKGKYKIIETISISQNVVICRCQSQKGGIYQLHYYQDGCPYIGDARRRYLSAPAITGIAKPFDVNEGASMQFDIFSIAGENIAAHNLGLMELLRYVIPQLVTGIEQLHRVGFLIRNLDPAEIYYDAATHKVMYTDLSNLVMIANGATATKAGAKGIKAMFYPPEFQSMGWSIYSDYYALGIAILIAMKGERIYAGISPEMIMKGAMKWECPGINRDQISKTDYSMLTSEQKMLYLVLGLTIPNPHKRWRLGEIRGFIKGHHIPLLQTGQKVRYEMPDMIRIENTECWDYDQVGTELLKNGRESEKYLQDVVEHIMSFNKGIGLKLKDINEDDSLSAQGKVFHMGYTLAPNTTGFWWNGRRMDSTSEIVKYSAAQGDKTALIRDMLNNRCFTFLMTLRGIKNPTDQKNYQIMSEMEMWESQEDDKGAARFLMQMGDDKSQQFQMGGREFYNIGKFLQAYENKPDQLKKGCRDLMEDKMFRGWVWSKGFGDAFTDVAESVNNEEEAFYAVMFLFERMGNESEKKKCRKLWLDYGPYSHITWLHHNLGMYNNRMANDMEYIRLLRGNTWTEDTSLDELNYHIAAMENAYQHFVRDTERSPVNVHCGIPIEYPKYLVPKEASACFCCKHHNAEVTPAYMRQMGYQMDFGEVNKWCDGNLFEANQWVDEQINLVRSTPGFGAVSMTSSISMQVVFSLVWIAAAISMYCFATAEYDMYFYFNNKITVLLPTIYLGISLLFPIMVCGWSLIHSNTASKRKSAMEELEKKIQYLEEIKKETGTCAEGIKKQIKEGGTFRIDMTQPRSAYVVGRDVGIPDNYMMGIGYCFIYVLSTVGFSLITTIDMNMLSLTGASMVVFWILAAIVMGCGDGDVSAGRGVAVLIGTVVITSIVYSIFHAYFLPGLIITFIVFSFFFK